MPILFLNAAGKTRSIGTANPVITGNTEKSGPISDIPDGQEVAYFRRYKSNKPGFENCVGFWRAATNTIERTNVLKSSDNGAPLVWGTGEQIIDITFTPAMLTDMNKMVEGEDALILRAEERARIATPVVSLPGMTRLTAIKGGEILAAFDPITNQGVGIEANLLNPSDIAQTMGYNRRRSSSFSHLMHTPPGFAGVNQGMFGIEPIVCHMGNGGTVTQPAASSWPFRRGLAMCGMSTNTASYAGVTSSNYPFTPDIAVSDFYFGAVVGLTALPAAGGQRFVVGIIPAPGNLAPTNGMYFHCSAALPNWQLSLDGTAISTTDTGVAVKAESIFSFAWPTLEIWAKGADSTVKFSIDKVLKGEINKAAFWPPSALYFAGAYCYQSGSAVANNLAVEAIHCSLTGLGAGDIGLGTELL